LARDGELHGYAIVKELQSIGELVAGEHGLSVSSDRAGSLLVSDRSRARSSTQVLPRKREQRSVPARPTASGLRSWSR
jgi:hypothetical protein